MREGPLDASHQLAGQGPHQRTHQTGTHQKSATHQTTTSIARFQHAMKAESLAQWALTLLRTFPLSPALHRVVAN
jgi:hypothetical protein